MIITDKLYFNNIMSLNVVGQSNLQDVSVNNITNFSNMLIQNKTINTVNTEDNDRDFFMYANSSAIRITDNNGIIDWNITKIGTSINNNGFVANKTGYYFIYLYIKWGSIRGRIPENKCGIGIKVNGTIANAPALIIAGNDNSIYTVPNGAGFGSMIVKVNKNQRITAYVSYGNHIKDSIISTGIIWWGGTSFFMGYYIGTS